MQIFLYKIQVDDYNDISPGYRFLICMFEKHLSVVIQNA